MSDERRETYQRLVLFGFVEVAPWRHEWQLSWAGRKFLEQLRREEDHAD